MVGAVLCSFVVVVGWLLCCGRVSSVETIVLFVVVPNISCRCASE